MITGLILKRARIRSVVRGVYAMPGIRAATRASVRLVAQRFPLSLKNRWRLHNFFAEDTAPEGRVVGHIHVPGAGSVKLEFDVSDYLSRVWYYLGYTGYETGTT